jgi:ubiquitin-protein ligase
MSFRRLTKEISQLEREGPAFGCNYIAWDDDAFHPNTLTASIRGPSGTPYEHGEFLLQLVFGGEWPWKCPRVRFVTPVFHPNVSPEGSIDNTVQNGEWSPAITVLHLLVQLQLHLGSTAFCHGSAPVGGPDFQFGLWRASGVRGMQWVLGRDAGNAWLTNVAAAESRARVETLEWATSALNALFRSRSPYVGSAHFSTDCYDFQAVASALDSPSDRDVPVGDSFTNFFSPPFLPYRMSSWA